MINCGFECVVGFINSADGKDEFLAAAKKLEEAKLFVSMTCKSSNRKGIYYIETENKRYEFDGIEKWCEYDKE